MSVNLKEYLRDAPRLGCILPLCRLYLEKKTEEKSNLAIKSQHLAYFQTIGGTVHGIQNRYLRIHLKSDNKKFVKANNCS